MRLAPQGLQRLEHWGPCSAGLHAAKTARLQGAARLQDHKAAGLRHCEAAGLRHCDGSTAATGAREMAPRSRPVVLESYCGLPIVAVAGTSELRAVGVLDAEILKYPVQLQQPKSNLS